MKKFIVGNWKMNPLTQREAKALLSSIKKEIGKMEIEPKQEIVICPPFLYIPLALKISNGDFKIGAQDSFWEEKGAFTGEISPLMLKEMKVEYVILGHSERRKYQKESNFVIQKKVYCCLKNGLKVILCIDKLSQLRDSVENIPEKFLRNLIVAYEPLFAIGTGKPCSPERGERMRKNIKNLLKKDIPVLYGGSVNSQNVSLYIKKAKFNGVLVGGASLKAKEFVDIIKEVCYG